MADAGADITGDALCLLAEDAKAAEAAVDVHQRRQRARKPTPDPAREVPVETDPEDPPKEQVDEPDVIQERHTIEERRVNRS